MIVFYTTPVDMALRYSNWGLASQPGRKPSPSWHDISEVTTQFGSLLSSPT